MFNLQEKPGMAVLYPGCARAGHWELLADCEQPVSPLCSLGLQAGRGNWRSWRVGNGESRQGAKAH